MNPRQKMNEKEIYDYNMRVFMHNFDKFDKLEDFSMNKIFVEKEKDKNNRPIRDKYTGEWKYREITERAKAFEDWKRILENIRKREKNKEDNPEVAAAVNSFLERMVDERKYDNPELLAITKEINKNTINKHIVQRNLGRNLKGKEWDTMPMLDRNNRISEVEIIDNPVSKYQKQINDLIKEYEEVHHEETNFNNELQNRASQPGFEFFNYGPKVMSKFK